MHHNHKLNPVLATLMSISFLPDALAGVICVESGFPDYEVVFLDGLDGPTFGARVINDAGEVAGTMDSTIIYVWTEDEIRTGIFEIGPVAVAGINEDGVVVGYVYDGAGNYDNFLWFSRTGELEIIDTPVPTFPNDVNNALTICGADDDNLFGFVHEVRSSAFHEIAFGDIPRVGVGTVGATAINESGMVVGAEVIFQEDFEFYLSVPYRWTEKGGIVPLPILNPPAGFGGYAVDVNENGDAAGTVINTISGAQPALWTNDGTTLTPIPPPFGFFVADATGLNNDNQVVIVAPNDLFGFTRAFLWEDGVYTDLSCFAPPFHFAIRPLDINNNGEILTQLSDAESTLISDVVILRPKALALVGDIDGDGDVDFTDLLLLLEAWGECIVGPACPADLDASGDVGFADLLILLANWS